MSLSTVLLAHSVAKIGGAEKVTLDVVKALQHSLYNPLVGALEDGPFLEEARKAGANTTVIPLIQPDIKAPLKSIKSRKLGLTLFKEHNIGLVHTGDIFVARPLLPIAARTNTPVICHMHFPPDDGALKWVFGRHGKDVSITFLYCSYELKKACEHRIQSLCPNAIHTVIHNGVDTDLFNKYPLPACRLLPQDKLNIGIVANLQKRKGHDEFLLAAQKLVTKYENLHFHVVGGDLFGDAREEELKATAKAYDLGNFITFHGQVSDVKPYLNELDIYVCASHEEAFPISILEAMAFSLPIVSTDVNGIPEALTSEVNALLVKPKRYLEISRAIEMLLRVPELRNSIGKQARADVCDLLSQENFQKKIKQTYIDTMEESTC